MNQTKFHFFKKNSTHRYQIHIDMYIHLLCTYIKRPDPTAFFHQNKITKSYVHSTYILLLNQY